MFWGWAEAMNARNRYNDEQAQIAAQQAAAAAEKPRTRVQVPQDQSIQDIATKIKIDSRFGVLGRR